MVTFELYGIVKSNKKIIAIGDGGKFSTEDERIIFKLNNLGFKRLDNIPEQITPKTDLIIEEPVEEKPAPKVKKVTKVKKVKK
jgi:hypothetical protein